MKHLFLLSFITVSFSVYGQVPNQVFGEYASIGYKENIHLKLNPDYTFEEKYVSFACLSPTYSRHIVKGQFQFQDGILQLHPEVLISDEYTSCIRFLTKEDKDTMSYVEISKTLSSLCKINDTIYQPQKLPYPFRTEFIVAFGEKEVWLFDDEYETASSLLAFINIINGAASMELEMQEFKFPNIAYDYLCKSPANDQMRQNHLEQKRNIYFLVPEWNSYLLGREVETKIVNIDLKQTKIDDCFIYDLSNVIEIDKGRSEGLQRGMMLYSEEMTCYARVEEIFEHKSLAVKGEHCECATGQQLSTKGTFD